MAVAALENEKPQPKSRRPAADRLHVGYEATAGFAGAQTRPVATDTVIEIGPDS
jgi:hypothetical protein